MDLTLTSSQDQTRNTTKLKNNHQNNHLRLATDETYYQGFTEAIPKLHLYCSSHTMVGLEPHSQPACLRINPTHGQTRAINAQLNRRPQITHTRDIPTPPSLDQGDCTTGWVPRDTYYIRLPHKDRES